MFQTRQKHISFISITFFVGIYFVASLLLFNSTIPTDLQITKNFELVCFLAMQVM